MKLTKIICTVGPASDSKEILAKMITHGMDVARFNFSHGDHAYHGNAIKRLRKIDEKIAVMLDTKGPEIRTDMLNEPIQLKKNDEIIFTAKKSEPCKKIIKLSYPHLMELKPGQLILISDGKIICRVMGKNKNGLLCRVLIDGRLGSKKNVAFPGVKIKLPELTKKDIDDINFGLTLGVDFIALSLVRKAETVKKVRKMLRKNKSTALIISKIETSEALKNLDEIISASDGIMIARGDLGLNIPMKKVPITQKTIIEKCNQAGKPVIVATQMLGSMTENIMPTRAEATDVANAVLDGADCLMLSDETASGKYPAESVKMMSDIIKEVDPVVKHFCPKFKYGSIPDSIASAISSIGNTSKIKAIFSPTETGFEPRLIAKFRPNVHILASTPSLEVSRTLAISRGVICFIPKHKDKLERMRAVIKAAVRMKILTSNDYFAVAYKNKLSGTQETVNALEVQIVRNVLKKR